MKLAVLLFSKQKKTNSARGQPLFTWSKLYFSKNCFLNWLGFCVKWRLFLFIYFFFIHLLIWPPILAIFEWKISDFKKKPSERPINNVVTISCIRKQKCMICLGSKCIENAFRTKSKHFCRLKDTFWFARGMRKSKNNALHIKIHFGFANTHIYRALRTLLCYCVCCEWVCGA